MSLSATMLHNLILNTSVKSGNPKDLKTYPFEDQIADFVDKGIKEKSDSIPRRTYLGGSSLGEKCSRKIQYTYMGQEVDQDRHFSPQTLRIFQFGHEIEDSMANWLKQAGFDLRTEKKNGDQYGFSISDGQIRGHIDGVICGGPVGMGYPSLWENKSANDRKFKEFQSKGMAKTNPIYAAQIALYKAYMELTEHPCLFTVVNKNTSEIYYELVPFDKFLAQEISDKAVNILQATKAGEMLPRIAQSKEMFDCKWCNYKETCWS